MKYNKLLRFFVFIIILLAASISVMAEPEYDGYIISFKDKTSEKIGLEIINSAPKLFSEDDFWEISDYHNMHKLDDLELVLKLDEMELLEYYHPDYICELYGYDYTKEPYFANQWQHEPTGIKRAWDLGIYGNNTKVVVIDSGVYQNHPDFAGNVEDGTSYVSGSLANTDIYGHGTFVSGIIAASANGSYGIGAAHKATIIPVKVTDSSSFAVSKLATAIINAVDEYEPDVINLSLGYSYNYTTDENGQQVPSASNAVTVREHNAVINAIDYAHMFNVIVIAAAGNGDTTDYSYPASLPGVVSVANVQKNGDGTYSHYYSSQRNDKVTISAPGTSVYSTTKNGGYGYWTGTSFSAPYVSAVAAMAKSVDPDITPEHFKELIIATADKTILGDAEYSNYYGYGMVNAGALLEMLIDEISPAGYVSPADTNPSGVTSVHLYNPTKLPKSWTFIAKGEQNGRPMAFSVKSHDLEPEQAVEVDISAVMPYGRQIYLLDSKSLKPVILG